MTLDKALDFWQVHAPIDEDSAAVELRYWAVSREDDGVVAYFSTERAACWYRLAMVNVMLNGGTDGR